MNKRLLAVLLCLVLLVGLMPFGALAVSNADTAYAAATTGSAASADVTSYLAFSSDVHNSSNNTSANRLNTWINNVTAKTGKDIDVMSFCGDNGSASAGESDFWTYTQTVMNTVNSNSHVKDSVFTTGNHEHYNGNFNSTSNNTAKSIKRIGEAKNASDYIIYAFGPKDWAGNTDQFYSDDLSTLDSYLGSLSSADRAKPIFILSHFPAHTFSGSGGGWGGMTRSTRNSADLISTLNKYGNQGYDIYFLWGHNHTVSDTHYDEVFTGSLDGTAINFTYLAAGCMSDSEYGTGSAFVKGKGLLVGINNKKVVSIQYFDANGNDVTEQGGSTTPTAQPTTAPSGTTPVSGKQYLIVCDGHVLTTAAGESYSNNGGGSGSYNYTGLAGATYSSGMTVTSDMVWTFTSSGSGFVISNNGKYLNGYYESNSSGGSNGDLKLESSQVDVWTLSGNTLKSTNGSSGASSDKYLAYGNGSQSNPNTFSVRSAPNANNSNVVNTLTFVEVSNGQAVEPSTQPTTTPSEPTSSVSITPTTDNPSASATINVGDTLTIKVTNSSTQADYDFTATLSNSGVAQLASSTVNIKQGATGTFTVTGLKAGTVDINITNNNSYSSSYNRKAVIHLTVVSGGTQPTTQPTTPATGNVYELTNSLAAGKDYLIVNVNSGSGYALVNNNGNLSTVAVTVSNGKITLDNSGAVFSAFTESGDLRLKNGNYYLDSTRNSSGNGGVLQAVTEFTSTSRTSAAWSYSNNQLKLDTEGTQGGGYTNTYTVYYDNGFKSTYETNSGKVYLFARTDSVTPTVEPTVEPTAEPTTTPVPSCTHPQTAISGKKAATCTENGYTGDTVCLKCGEIVTKGEVIPATGHDTELRGKKDATCTIDGYTGDYVCKVCGETVATGSVIKAEGHETVLRGAKAAACETDGYTGDEVCKVCGETVKKGEVIKATGHAWDDGTITKAATCTEDGVMTFVCKTDASHTKTEVIPAKGHTLVAVPGVPATEDAEGMEPYWKCSECGKLFSDAEGKHEIAAPVVIEKLDHTHNLTKVAGTPATCTEPGVEDYWKCAKCGAMFSDAEGTKPITAPVVIAALGHDTELKNAKDATCEEAGYTGDLVCKVCGEVVKAGEVIEAKGHELVKHDAKAPTETEAGNIEYWECSECGKLFADAKGEKEIKIEDTVVPATGKQPCDGGKNCPSIILTDVDRSAKSFYHHAVDWAFVNDITKGTSETLFSPAAPCTREQMVTFLWRMNGSPAPDMTKACPFVDLNEKEYSYPAILWAYQNNVTNGTDATHFSPKANVTREQVVTLLWRLAGSEKVEGTVPFTDIAASRYSFEAVKWAVKEGITDGRTPTTFAPGENCTRAEIVTFLWRSVGKPLV